MALLFLLAIAFATGVLAFAIGSGWVAWPVVAHGVTGFAILLLARPKSRIVERGLERRGPSAWPSVVFAVLIVTGIATGFAHSTGWLRTAGRVSAMQVHVALALVALPFGLWHVVARRTRPRKTDVSRRALLRTGAVAAASAAMYGAFAGGLRLLRAPGTSRRRTGSFESGSFDPRAMPVTQWLDDAVPVVEAESWSLPIVSRGREVTRLTLQRLDEEREPVRATIDCTGGWYAEQVWEGVRLDRLLGEDPSPAGRSITVHSVTRYWRRFPITDSHHLWLATRVGGQPLSAGHGFPARLVAPNRRGFWWVKWVSVIEVGDAPWWWQPPFPLT